MYLDRVIYPVTALGPGNRVAIWTVGCNRKCEGCANPELWERHPEQLITADKLAEYLNAMKDKGIDGLLQVFVMKKCEAVTWTMATNFDEKTPIKL